ncbi:MAG TPA: nicotinate phosphoribosyltransferase [Alphaproteobacteria bacterium]
MASPGEPVAPGDSDFEAELGRRTDHYFKRTRDIVRRYGDIRATYALFMRRPVIFCPRLAVEWLERAASERATRFDIELCFEEGAWVGAGEPLMYVTGPLSELVDLETIYLQLLGPPCVAAYNAFTMCADMPGVAFLAMDARHCAGAEMAEMMAYAASVGSTKARREANAIGFIGNSNDETAHYFGNRVGLGTMPHALLGFAGSTVRAAEMFHDTYPDEPLTVLVDYFGCEVSDSIAVGERFPDLARDGRLRVRVDTHGGRFVEGLDTARSYDVLERHAPQAVRTYRSETELRWLVGTGVTAASIFHLRDALDQAGFGRIGIVASSGFNPGKCKVFASVAAPVDMIGTGSYLPERWSETYATADIVAYDGRPSVKVGREFLLRRPGQAEGEGEGEDAES